MRAYYKERNLSSGQIIEEIIVVVQESEVRR